MDRVSWIRGWWVGGLWVVGVVSETVKGRMKRFMRPSLRLFWNPSTRCGWGIPWDAYPSWEGGEERERRGETLS